MLQHRQVLPGGRVQALLGPHGGKDSKGMIPRLAEQPAQQDATRGFIAGRTGPVAEGGEGQEASATSTQAQHALMPAPTQPTKRTALRRPPSGPP